MVELNLYPSVAEGVKLPSLTLSFSKVLFPTEAKKLLKVLAVVLQISSGSVLALFTFVLVASFNFIAVVVLFSFTFQRFQFIGYCL